MTRSLLALLLAVGCLGGALAAPDDKKDDPKSNNKDKIVGKWKITGGGGAKEEELKLMRDLGIYVYLEFKNDGTLRFGAEASDPKVKKLLENGKETLASCKYKLLGGDEVEIYDIPKDLQDKDGGPFGKKDRAKGMIKIDGDKMTISDDDKLKTDPMKLTKVK